MKVIKMLHVEMDGGPGGRAAEALGGVTEAELHPIWEVWAAGSLWQMVKALR